SVSMFATLMITSFTSLFVTLIIYKLGQDPAFGSGPFATVISDMTSIAVYMLMAVWLL
ncbi:MAG TPA: magnesium transporter, partial [Nanoarchaeota archaeon]|nr:magnesium transporter [Nanoarchaeota archaeon]